MARVDCPTCGTKEAVYVPDEYPKEVLGQVVQSREEEQALVGVPATSGRKSKKAE